MFLAAQTVCMKSKYALGFDLWERVALEEILADCES